MKFKFSPTVRKLFLIFGLVLTLGAPFLGRAYFVDDHYHMLMAQGLLDHPTRPYDFLSDDDGVNNAGWVRGEPPRMVNPPGHHYVLALFWKISGGRLWVVRLGQLILSGLTAIFIYLLAQRFLVSPWIATVMCVVTPAFWLSSYSLLIDTTLLFFFLGGLWFWIDGLDRSDPKRLTVAGLSMGLATFTKYTGGFVALLALLWWIGLPKEKRRLRDVWALGWPLVFMVGWSLWNVVTYGEPHITAASKRVLQEFAWVHVITYLSFFSGTLIAPLLGLWMFLDTTVGRILGGIGGIVLYSVFSAKWGGFSGDQSVLLALFLSAGVGFFLMLPSLWRQTRVSSDRFLIVWFLLATLQMIYIMQWVAARYYLTLLVPVVFLVVRWIERRYVFSPSKRDRFQGILIAAMVMVSVSLAWADYAQANTARRIAQDATQDGWLQRGGRCFYLGDSFTSSYLRYAGWSPAFAETPLAPGDLVMRQEVIMPAWWFRVQERPFHVLKTYTYPSAFPVRVMDNRGSAGFYASAWGALPFTFSRGPLERYTLLEVEAHSVVDTPPSK